MHAVHAYGDTALIVTSLNAPAAFARSVLEAGLDVQDVATGADSVLVQLHRAADAPAIWAALSRLTVTDAASGIARQIEIPVRYDGIDLAEVAEIAGCSTERLIELHTAAEFTVAFCGFAPGFAYLIGLPAILHVPRLDSPRPSIPAGSVAIAAEFAGVYPRSSPGGWRILGTTELTMFDELRTPPALLTPGDRVRFVRA